jgi:CubicO group peptidase (beta-lactamase class C family)
MTMALAMTLSWSIALGDGPAIDAALMERVDAIIADAMAQPGAVGFSVALAKGDEPIIERAVGKADLEFDVDADPQTMFRIGSITKQFTAAAIMKLAEQCRLALDDDITKHLHDYPTHDHTVTIRHLLTHTSGIRSYTGIPGFMEKHTSDPLSHEELLAFFKDEPLEFAPGARFAYNNSGYYLLGMIIENVAGAPYGDFLQAEFFAPLGLTRTRYDSTEEVIVNRAQGYTLRNGALCNDKSVFMGIPGAAGGLISTAGDLVRWQIALISGGVVTAESYKLMTTPFTLSDGASTRYGFGLAVGDLDGKPVVDHGGGIFGFTSFLAYFPDDKLHVALIANSDAVSSDRIAREIARAALGIEKPPVHDLALDDSQRQPFIGQFKFADIPLEARIFEQDGQLMIQATNQPAFRLLCQGDREFRASFDTDVRFVFSEDFNSFVLYQGGAELRADRTDAGTGDSTPGP